jgi:threonyl-tRNA synthetase
LLIEHHGGAFPAWLSPVQAMVLPISEKHQQYAEKVHQALHDAGIRAELDGSSNTLNYRIRTAQNQKVPYMLVVGDREAEANKVAVRVRTGEDQGAVALAEFITFAREKIDSKAFI